MFLVTSFFALWSSENGCSGRIYVEDYVTRMKMLYDKEVNHDIRDYGSDYNGNGFANIIERKIWISRIMMISMDYNNKLSSTKFLLKKQNKNWCLFCILGYFKHFIFLWSNKRRIQLWKELETFLKLNHEYEAGSSSNFHFRNPGKYIL